MAVKENTQIKILLLEMDHFIAKLQEKSDQCSKEIIAAKSFQIEIEALVTARNNLDQEVSAKIDKARQWLNQKIDKFKIEEESHENKGLIVAMPISSKSNLTRSTSLVARGSDVVHFLQGFPSNHYKYSFQKSFEQQMNTALGISADALPGSLNPLPEDIEQVKAGLCEGLDNARERSVFLKEALSNMSEQFFPSTSPSKTIDIDESKKEGDNRTAFHHSEDQGKEKDMPNKMHDSGNMEEYWSRKRIGQKLVLEEVTGISQSSATSKKRAKRSKSWPI